MPKTDFDFWNPANGNVSRVLGQGNDGSFTDSVEPVYRAADNGALGDDPTQPAPGPPRAHAGLLR